MHSYLSNKQRKTKINKIMRSVLALKPDLELQKAQVLVPLLFNKYVKYIRNKEFNVPSRL